MTAQSGCANVAVVAALSLMGGLKGILRPET